MHPRIERPVYALALASNIADVALLNSSPSWLVDVQAPPAAYAALATSVWRERWLPTAERRLLQQEEFIPEAPEWLLARKQADESR